MRETIQDLADRARDGGNEAQARRRLHLRRVPVPATFAVGQVWATAGALSANDWWKIEAVTDHPTSPVIARSRCDAIRCFSLNGHFDGEDEPGDLDLVTLVREVGL